MQESYVTFEQAKLLKEFGFPQDEYSCVVYKLNGNKAQRAYLGDDDYPYKQKECDCPTLSSAQKWLREAKGIYIDVQTTYLGPCGYAFDYLITKEDKEVLEDNHTCFTYEDALSLGIDVALKLDFDNISDGYIVIKTPIE